MATTHAAVPDAAKTATLHQAFDQRELPPSEHYLDSGHLSAALLVEAKSTYGIALVTPLPADTSPQALARGGHPDVIAVDFDKPQVACPQGQSSTSWNTCTQRGTETVVAAFPVSVCGPVRSALCTTC
ncbi:hypothetical protein [Streptomyces caeruleatus]|uniref:Uncharacterized protein n=1 Tax=Streptomyces caeruleatus TaxID=661399 RepID=A0A124I776_9ACTN|nr:hypothetical protein [Streptomyces caeruleatus]KUN95399.1 hypothetical protein AQJ67_36020 [Streptomyces caeruleatus]